MAETDGTAAVQDTSPSVASFVGDIMGDFLTAEPESDAGASPAATPDRPESEGTDPSAPAGAPPATADAQTTVPDPNAPAPESDPLEGATPLSYVVNGEARQFEGITKLKSGEGIIEPDAMALLERRLGERDHLFERSQEQFRQIDELGKLTEWRIRGENGQEQVLTGREGVQAQRLALGNAIVEVRELRALLNDPAKLSALLLLDEQNNITLNQDALSTLATRIENAQLKAGQQVRAAMARYGATPTPAAAASQGFDPAAIAPKALDVAITHAGATGLTADDRKFLEGQAPLYIRQATADDVRANPAGGYKVGDPIVDPRFVEVVKDRAKLRATTSAQVSSASEAAKVNQANLAAAAQGKKPTPRPATPAPKAPTPTEQREDEEDAAFDARMKTSANLIRQAVTI